MLSDLFGDDAEDGSSTTSLGMPSVGARRAAAPPLPRAPSQLVGLDNQVRVAILRLN
jgi:hypothetical protein